MELSIKEAMQPIKKGYRYRQPSRQDGVTRFSTEAINRHLWKVGDVVSIRLYVARVKTPYGVQERPRVMVKGTHGTARFGGLLWGYKGQGPQATVDLVARAFDCPKIVAEKIVWGMPNDYFKMDGRSRIRTIAVITP